MTNYYTNHAIQEFQHPIKPKSTNLLPKYKTPTHREKIKYDNPEDTSNLIPPSDINHIQQVINTLLYYEISVDNNMSTTLVDVTFTQ